MLWQLSCGGCCFFVSLSSSTPPPYAVDVSIVWSLDYSFDNDEHLRTLHDTPLFSAATAHLTIGSFYDFYGWKVPKNSSCRPSTACNPQHPAVVALNWRFYHPTRTSGTLTRSKS